jgi:hypothetical protein
MLRLVSVQVPGLNEAMCPGGKFVGLRQSVIQSRGRCRNRVGGVPGIGETLELLEVYSGATISRLSCVRTEDGRHSRAVW